MPLTMTSTYIVLHGDRNFGCTLNFATNIWEKKENTINKLKSSPCGIENLFLKFSNNAVSSIPDGNQV
jgi:hypothetical protein